MTRQLLSLAVALPPGLPAAQALAIATMAGRLGFSAVHLQDASETGDLDRLAAAAAPALLVTGFPADALGLVRTNDPGLVAEVRAELESDRDRRISGRRAQDRPVTRDPGACEVPGKPAPRRRSGGGRALVGRRVALNDAGA